MSLSSRLRKRLRENNSKLNSVTDVNCASSANMASMSLSQEEALELKSRERRMPPNFNAWRTPEHVQETSTVKTRSDGGLNRLKEDFYNQSCVDLAKRLLGKTLVRILNDGTVLKGLIVETESYLGEKDKASHSFGNKVTDRNEPMYMYPGTSYVYLTYGMYHMLNISSKGDGSAVLIRALQPLQGIDMIQKNRDNFNFKNSKKRYNAPPAPLRDFELCNGPAKLTIGLAIDMNCNKQNLSKWPYMWIDNAPEDIDEDCIVKCKRIGIESAGEEWATKPLRFYIYGNKSVSKKDKVGEIALLEKREVNE